MEHKPSIDNIKVPAGFGSDKQFKTGKVSAPSSFLITINSNKSQRFIPNAEWIGVGRRLIYLAQLTEYHFGNGDFVKKKNPDETLRITNFRHGLEKTQRKTEAHIHIVVNFNIACQIDIPAFNRMIYENSKPEIVTKPYVNVKHFKDVGNIMNRYVNKQSFIEPSQE